MDSFIETRIFSRLAREYLTDDEYSGLQQALIDNPDCGPVIPGSGGIRKMRLVAQGRGNRSGYRIIYYIHRRHGIIWLLTMYPKNMTETISAHVLKQIREEIESGQD